jgi:hypothetical protein
MKKTIIFLIGFLLIGSTGYAGFFGGGGGGGTGLGDVTGPTTPTAGNLTKWGPSGKALVDGPKLGTFTDAKWCSFSTSGGVECTQTAPQVALTNPVTGPASPTTNNIPKWSGTGQGLVDGWAVSRSTGSAIPVLAASPGTPDATKFLRDDGTWVNPPGTGVPYTGATGDVTLGVHGLSAAFTTIGSTLRTTGSGSPEGVVAASKGAEYRDTATGDIYNKSTDTVNTGWVKVQSVSVGNTKVVCTDSSGNPIACTNLTDVVPLVSGGAIGAATATTASAGDESTKVATTYFVDHAYTVVGTATPVAVTTSGYYWNKVGATSAAAFNLPAIAVGQQYCFGNWGTYHGAVTVAINTQSGVSIYYKGIAGTASTGTLVSGGAAGDFICMEAVSATEYMCTGDGKGTWTNN